MNQTLEILYDLIMQETHCQRSDLRPDATLIDLGIDSLALIELIFDLEDKLGFKLPEDQRQFNTIQDVVNFIEEVKAARQK